MAADDQAKPDIPRRQLLDALEALHADLLASDEDTDPSQEETQNDGKDHLEDGPAEIPVLSDAVYPDQPRVASAQEPEAEASEMPQADADSRPGNYTIPAQQSFPLPYSEDLFDEGFKQDLDRLVSEARERVSDLGLGPQADRQADTVQWAQRISEEIKPVLTELIDTQLKELRTALLFQLEVELQQLPKKLTSPSPENTPPTPGPEQDES